MALSTREKAALRAGIPDRDTATTIINKVNMLDNKVASASFSIAAEAGDTIVVSIQLKDEAGADMATAATVLAYLSDNSTGLDVSADDPSGTVAGGTDGSTVLLKNKTVFLMQSEADGDIDLSIGEAGADTWYLVVVLPNGSHAVSSAITFA